MTTVAVTGGVACGKTSACDRLMERLPDGRVDRFDSDRVVASRLAQPEVREVIRGFEGGEALFSGGELDRAEMRRRAFENSSFREKLEELLHPLVLEEAVATRNETEADMLLMEVPLLYEVELPLARDLDLVIAASEPTQRERLLAGRGIGREQAEKMIRSQLPMCEKIERGDIVVWNDAGRETLRRQVDHLASRCTRLFSNQ